MKKIKLCDVIVFWPLWYRFVTLPTQPQSPPANPTDPPTKPLARVNFRPISGCYCSFSTVFSKTAKIDSKSAPLRGVAQCVWPYGGRGLWLEVRSQVIDSCIGALAAPVRDTPHIAQYPFEIVSQRGVWHPFASCP